MTMLVLGTGRYSIYYKQLLGLKALKVSIDKP